MLLLVLQKIFANSVQERPKIVKDGHEGTKEASSIVWYDHVT